jgi:hypothetical protein
MFRRFTIFAFSALVALATLAAATSPSAAGHRDRVHFGVGIGFGSGYVQFGHAPRPRFHSPRIRYHHARPYHHRRHYVPVYRHYHPPVVYHRPRVHYRHGGSHVEWCYARYRSYRAWDNTFQPYHGGRRQCWSPYS